MDSRLEQDVVIFQDSQQQYEFGVTLPLRNQAGMSDSGQESIWDIQTAYNVVSGRGGHPGLQLPGSALTPQDQHGKYQQPGKGSPPVKRTITRSRS